MNENKRIIPIVFSVDDNYAPFLAVNIRSILDNGSKDNFYKFFILITELNDININNLKSFSNDNCEIDFIDVNKKFNNIAHKLALRDYYTLTIYYRLFIPSIFNEYDKILYLDCDMVVKCDVAELFDYDLGDNIVGACREEVMTMVGAFGKYSEDCLGVDRNDYFNSGLLLINCIKYREMQVEKRFLDLLNFYKFEVAPDQDYLNVLCKDKVLKLSIGYNKAPVKNKDFNDKDLKIIHYKLWYKPWFYSDILYEKYFWQSAKKTPYFNLLKNIRENYSHENVVKDLLSYKNLVKLATTEARSAQNYLKRTLVNSNVNAW